MNVLRILWFDKLLKDYLIQGKKVKNITNIIKHVDDTTNTTEDSSVIEVFSWIIDKVYLGLVTVSTNLLEYLK